MRQLSTLSLAAIATASPALAHGGAHIHPHGAGTWIALACAGVLAAVSYYIWGRK